MTVPSIGLLFDMNSNAYLLVLWTLFSLMCCDPTNKELLEGSNAMIFANFDTYLGDQSRQYDLKTQLTV